MRLCLEGLVTEFVIQDFPTSRFELNKNTKDVGFEYGCKMLMYSGQHVAAHVCSIRVTYECG